MNSLFSSWRHLRYLVAVSVSVMAIAASAADYPSRPITLIVPFSPGGSTDVQARLVAKELSKKLGQPVVVDNKPGAGSAIGTRMVAAAEGDGYTLLFASISQVTGPIVDENAGYDLLHDFAPVSIVTDMPFLMVVNCNTGAKSAGDLIAQAKAKPGAFNYSSWGYGSVGNVLGEMFKHSTNLDLAHIPYKGEAPAIVALMTGEASVTFLTPVGMPYITSKQLCPLAVTAPQRIAKLPNVPTFNELGIKNMDLQIWFGVVAPIKTPPAVVDRLQRAVKEVVADPEFVQAIDAMGVTGVGSTPSEFSQRIRADQTLIGTIAKTAKLKE